MDKKAVIIGAGPAGLTAAYELSSRTSIKATVLEQEKYLGGISTTINYKGNKMDLGGHRFFTKSDRVLDWWFTQMPIDEDSDINQITYRNQIKSIKSIKKGKGLDTFLIRSRKSRIFYKSKLFDYPISLSIHTLTKINPLEILEIFITYIYARIFPKKENNLEDFFINRFGYKLYKTFFQSYTEKVWGKSCHDISPEWGSQRVKGLSLTKAITDVFFKSNETSLIEYFLYPKKGPGHLWQVVARNSKNNSVDIKINSKVEKITKNKNNTYKVLYRDKSGTHKINADYLFSSMPIKNLFQCIEPKPPKNLLKIAKNLEYRDFIVVGLLIKNKLKKFDDNWIYVHDPTVDVGRIQFFNNWSPHLVKNNKYSWVGMEYFCNNNDHLWQMSPKKLAEKAKQELEKLGISSEKYVIDYKVVKVPKAYPSYTGVYKDFDKLVEYLSEEHPNLYPIGRNGMHKYNNQDHSMLTAMVSVDNIISGRKDKKNIWSLNTEEDYHESN